MLKKYWTNKQGLKVKIGFCPYHPKTRLDNFSECEECEKMLINYGKKRGKENNII